MKLLDKFEQYSHLSTSKRIDGMAELTKKFVLSYLKDFESFGNVSYYGFINYLSEKELAHSTKAAIAVSVGKYLKFIGLITDTEYKDIRRMFRFPQKIWGESITLEIVEKLFEAVDFSYSKFVRDRNKCILSLFATTGARVSQLIDLNNINVRVKNEVIKVSFIRKKENRKSLEQSYDIKTIPKNITFQGITVGQLFDNYIKIKGRTQAFFVNRKKERLRRNTIIKMVHGLGKDIGVDIHTHSFRHYVAARVANQSGIHKAAILLGHKNIMTTMRYINPETVDTSEIIRNMYRS